MKTRVVRAAEAISPAVALLASGDIVGLPTETVYGLGADALNPTACAKIFEAKRRPLNDPLIVHVPNAEWAARLADFSPEAWKLAEAFWPGPLTLVLPRRAIVPDIVTSGQSTVAIRWSSHPVFQEIVESFGKPIAAPSANRFGRISPTCAEDVVAELDGEVALVVDGGRCVHGLESAIVCVEGGDLRVLRNGPVTSEELATFGNVVPAGKNILAPGGAKSHYAPATPVEIVTEVPPPRAGVGLLAWANSGSGYAEVERLSAHCDLREAAANLFGAMRRLDARGLDLILAEAVPARGLGASIMERLHKAAAR